jgi:hypothetical protein
MRFIPTIALALLLAVAASAHHSFSMFNQTTTVTLTGTIKEFQWTNPHSFTWVEVKKEDGTVETWGLEGMSPNYLGRRGWSKHTLKPGDPITVTINPLKDGQKGGMFLRCKLADGKEMFMFGGPPGAKQ